MLRYDNINTAYNTRGKDRCLNAPLSMLVHLVNQTYYYKQNVDQSGREIDQIPGRTKWVG